MGYADEGVPLVVLAGKEYGSGSSRDWAAKGTTLLGVRAVIAESFERIHRSNLIGMGVLPLQFPEGETIDSLGLTGEETFDVGDLAERRGEDGRGDRSPRRAATTSRSRRPSGSTRPNEVDLLPERRHPAPGPARPALQGVVGPHSNPKRSAWRGRGRQGVHAARATPARR